MLRTDIARWGKYTASVKQFQSATNGARQVVQDETNEKNKKAVELKTDIYFPVRSISEWTHVPVFVHSSIQMFADVEGVDASDASKGSAKLGAD